MALCDAVVSRLPLADGHLARVLLLPTGRRQVHNNPCKYCSFYSTESLPDCNTSGECFTLHLRHMPLVSASIQVVVMAGWSLALVTGFLVVFGMYSYNNFIAPMPYDVMTQITYSGLHRLAWGAALAWVVFACHNGYGGTPFPIVLFFTFSCPFLSLYHHFFPLPSFITVFSPL